MILIHETSCLNHFASLKHGEVVNYHIFFKKVLPLPRKWKLSYGFSVLLDCKGTGFSLPLELGFRWEVFFDSLSEFWFFDFSCAATHTHAHAYAHVYVYLLFLFLFPLCSQRFSMQGV